MIHNSWKPFRTCFFPFILEKIYEKMWNYVHFDIFEVEMKIFWSFFQERSHIWLDLLFFFPSVIVIKLLLYISNSSFMLYLDIAGHELDTRGLISSMLHILPALGFLPILGR